MEPASTKSASPGSTSAAAAAAIRRRSCAWTSQRADARLGRERAARAAAVGALHGARRSPRAREVAPRGLGGDVEGLRQRRDPDDAVASIARIRAWRSCCGRRARRVGAGRTACGVGDGGSQARMMTAGPRPRCRRQRGERARVIGQVACERSRRKRAPCRTAAVQVDASTPMSAGATGPPTRRITDARRSEACATGGGPADARLGPSVPDAPGELAGAGRVEPLRRELAPARRSDLVAEVRARTECSSVDVARSAGGGQSSIASWILAIAIVATATCSPCSRPGPGLSRLRACRGSGPPCSPWLAG